ncbi:MAG: hypothetical protein WKG07_16270 [Hymenobacter sp.]
MYLATLPGVRRHGRAGLLRAARANLIGDPTAGKAILTAALNIHSVEARHSSHVRTMRRGYSTGAANTNGTTIAGPDNGGPGDTVPKSGFLAPTMVAPSPPKR